MEIYNFLSEYNQFNNMKIIFALIFFITCPDFLYTWISPFSFGVPKTLYLVREKRNKAKAPLKT